MTMCAWQQASWWPPRSSCAQQQAWCGWQHDMWGRELAKLKLMLISPAGDPALRLSLCSSLFALGLSAVSVGRYGDLSSALPSVRSARLSVSRLKKACPLECDGNGAQEEVDWLGVFRDALRAHHKGDSAGRSFQRPDQLRQRGEVSFASLCILHFAFIISSWLSRSHGGAGFEEQGRRHTA
jgi:hypothetical protein